MCYVQHEPQCPASTLQMKLESLRNKLGARELGIAVIRDVRPQMEEALRQLVLESDAAAICWLENNKYWLAHSSFQTACAVSANEEAGQQAIWRKMTALPESFSHQHLGQAVFKGNMTQLCGVIKAEGLPVVAEKD